MRSADSSIALEVSCYHCGQPCTEKNFEFEEKNFCCYGCKTVYEILSENNLCEYYSFDKSPGVQLKHVKEESYSWLDEPAIRKKLLTFDSASFSTVQFSIPNVHCISCIWLLENLHRLNRNILKSEVNFSRKWMVLSFNPKEISLSSVANLIASLGYPPQISLEGNKRQPGLSTKKLITRLAVAGFAFGNVMLLSFPEYLGLDRSDEQLQLLFSYLNIILTLPVIFYSSQEYFGAAWKSFRQKQINIDVPIAAGLAALFLRSVYDIVTQTGPGYLDSLTGLVFFLLIGRWFQSKTYESLAFDRDYKSYFPLAVNKLIDNEWKPALVYELRRGDVIRVRNMEIVPADSILLDHEAYIDYSFVTGESKPVHSRSGDLIYAGGRLIGQPATLTVDKITSQSQLTSLWNSDAFRKNEESKYRKIIDRAARKFTWVVMGIALVTGGYWYFADPSQLWLVITSVLMVACPCALALAAPFTFGSMLRTFGKDGFYLKNADVIERLATLDAVVFDKTGTITYGAADVKFIGVLDDQELGWVKLLTSSSTHPLSVLIAKSISIQTHVPIEFFKEKPGRGIEGIIANHRIMIGSASFVGFEGKMTDMASKVFVSVNDQVRGYFYVLTALRPTIAHLIEQLNGKTIALLSGDDEADRERMRSIFPAGATLLFNQTPHDKLKFISELQKKGKKVMMIGDGLNDSGALQQSDVGVAITDDTGVFTPACDGILKGDRIESLNQFFKLAKSAALILKIGFGISFFYNLIALSFAVTGHLTPLTAAVLMPISSSSVVGFSTLAVYLKARSVKKEKRRS
jgi:P-type Cu+ transporter